MNKSSAVRSCVVHCGLAIPFSNNSRRLLLLAAGCLAIAASDAIGQTNASPAAVISQNAKPLEFDVATIKPNDSGSHIIVGIEPRPDGFVVENIPLKILISEAYGIREDLISGGPGWIVSDHYDIEGKVTGSDAAGPQKLSENQLSEMIRSLLADRFQLAVHTETKEMPVYELVMAKNGPKLTESKPGERGVGSNRGDIQADAVTMSTLADLLARQLQTAVVDKTGLTGKYHFRLKWDAELSRGSQDASASDPSGEPSLFTAIQEQLGLKLEPAKDPVQTLVIDHAERPSEN